MKELHESRRITRIDSLLKGPRYNSNYLTIIYCVIYLIGWF